MLLSKEGGTAVWSEKVSSVTWIHRWVSHVGALKSGYVCEGQQGGQNEEEHERKTVN